MALLERALWQIEMKLAEPLDLALLASTCASSPYHLSRVFRSATGLSPMAYLRARRLTEAARRLAASDDPILSVALDAQFQSHEAFTRAFASCFGVLPSSVRKARSTSTLILQEPIKMDTSRIVDVAAPEMKRREGFQVIGMSVDCSLESLEIISPLWARFTAREQEIEASPDAVAYGICHDMDAQGRFTYLAGLEPVDGADLPDGMKRLQVPGGEYAVFTHKGHITDIANTVYTIWNKSLPDLGLEPREAPDFERYDNRFDPETGRGEVEIWIPVAV